MHDITGEWVLSTVAIYPFITLKRYSVESAVKSAKMRSMLMAVARITSFTAHVARVSKSWTIVLGLTALVTVKDV
jgi:hypothetical protein